MTALGIARLGDEALLRAAGAGLVVTSLDQVDVGALVATGALRARPETETPLAVHEVMQPIRDPGWVLTHEGYDVLTENAG